MYLPTPESKAMTEIYSLEQLCAKAGLKMTGQRKVILSVLESATDHPSVEDVYARAKDIDELGYEMIDHTLELYGRKIKKN